VPVAFALDAPLHAPDELRLTAARALRSGASREAVWKALTEDAARLAGAKSAGTLAVGQDADFVLWSGDPLDLTSRVLSVWIDGKRAWAAETER
jgi:imidazolonepropionase-like amidohydrolase